MRGPRPTFPRLDWRPLALAALATAAVTSPAHAQNLLANPDIAGGSISPWTVCGGDAGKTSGNRTVCADSDALQAISAQVDCGLGLLVHELAIRQCVPLVGTGLVAGSSKVFFSAWTYVIRPEVMQELGLRYFASDDCSGDEISHTGGGVGGISDWNFLSVFDAVTVPAGTASIEYRLIDFDLDHDTFFYAFFDDAYLGTRTRLFDEGFERPSDTPDAPCAWNAYSP